MPSHPRLFRIQSDRPVRPRAWLTVALWLTAASSLPGHELLAREHDASRRPRPEESLSAGHGSLKLEVDVNRATAAELEQVKGIGPKTAQRIVDVRERGGRFRNGEDLRRRVPGIGTARLRKMVSAGLMLPADRAAAIGSAPGSPRVELIMGQPPGKRDPGRGGVILGSPAPGAHR